MSSEPTPEELDAPASESPVASRAPDLGSIADGVRSRESYAVSIDAFEGPLDLLLHLVRRHELDVLDIPIAFVAEKYVEYLEFAKALDVEIAGEYLVMAATLAYLKSRELLPPQPEEEVEESEEDGVDPREELIRRLIDYERFRAASADLDARPVVGRDVFSRGGDVDVPPLAPELAPITLFKLADAYNKILERVRIHKSHEVDLEPVNIRARMRQLSLMLGDHDRLDFVEMFTTQTWHSEKQLRQMLVVTLMSILEMCKLGVLSVHQPEGSETILLERIGDPERVRQVVETFEADGGEGGELPTPD